MPNRNIIRSSQISRRNFLATVSSAFVGSIFIPKFAAAIESMDKNRIRPFGPASAYIPSLKVAFVRRKGEYGMRWPGQIYDGETAFKNYRRQIIETGENLGLKLNIRAEPIYSPDEADQWIAEAKAQTPDGLMIVVLDRQEHAWPTVDKAIESHIPTVVFSPLGTSFTTNTSNPSKKEGVFICSTDDFSQAAFGMKMIKVGARLRETRFLVIRGNEYRDGEIKHFGTKLRYIPAQDFSDEYHRIPETDMVRQLADELIKNATGIHGPSTQDIYNGIKSYLVATKLLEQKKCDGITMDCLGALGKTKISLPCIAWSRMNDHAMPAACEADLGACVTHALVQYLFDRPGFQQDPVAETAKDCLIGSHCSCPTKLNGFASPAEPYDIVVHHGKRDATARPLWKIGQQITVADIILSEEGSIRSDRDVGDKNQVQMIISAGEVVDNKSVPPSGGCVVAPMVKLDQVSDLLDYPGFHQLFFYGDYKKELKSYCQLFSIKPVVV